MHKLLFVYLLSLPLAGLAMEAELVEVSADQSPYKPNYYYLGLGYETKGHSFKVPNMNTTETASTSRNHIKGSMGIGFDRQKSNLQYGTGIHFNIDWLNSDGRWSEFSKNTSYETFPLSLHNSKRRYWLTPYMKSTFGNFIASVESEFELARSGSDAFRKDDAPTSPDATVHKMYRLTPNGEYSLADHHFRIFTVFHKKISDVSDDLSFKTYDAKDRKLSFGVGYGYDFEPYATTVDVDIYQYQFIFNDPFKDYTRKGLALNLQKEMESFQFFGSISYNKDDFDVKSIGSADCSSLSGASGSSQGVGLCRRSDTSIQISPGVRWNFMESMAAEAVYQYRSQNSNFNIFDTMTNHFFINLTFYEGKPPTEKLRNKELGYEGFHSKDLVSD